MAPSNKDDKLIIKKIRFDDNLGIKSTIVQNNKDISLCGIFIETLLQPEQWLKDSHDFENERFIFSIDQMATLTKQCMEIVAKQPNILKVSAPVKVF